MKGKILKVSVLLLSSAIFVSLVGSIFINDPAIALRVSAITTTLTVGSIGMWAIGLICPKE